ncbi:sensor histidine kinase [Carnobacterium divergens]|uniref:sensor histidine kinase n=1 Tax=Carnobacterium divergens TaxID=2748 RepID=UPI00288D4C49|nr:HAMP domain-containing sensor histidine kinase [Carnobacterium divergens]MDT2012941.1 HAMP domain-containing histidine kinase [Carnobacterium divergens]
MFKRVFFFKNMLINVITIFFVSIIILTIISRGYYDYVYGKKERSFYEAQSQIIEKAKSGYSDKDLQKIYQNGYHIHVFNKGNLLFSSDNLAIYIGFDSKTGEFEQKFDKYFYDNSSSNLYSKKIFYVGKEKYNIYISKPIDIPKPELMENELKRLVPMFIIIGAMISLITSYIYDSYMRNQLKKVGNMLNEMKDFKLKKEYPTKVNGELENLEKQIIDMYNNLVDTSIKLKKEVTKVKRMEKDRYDFIRGVTHELKTPIMTTKIILSEMLNTNVSKSERENYLIKIDDTLSDINILITDVISMYRYEHYEDKGSSNVKKALSDILKIYDVLLNDRRLKIVIDIQDESQLINIPFNGFMKILSNLISNASKYAPYNSIINISVLENEFSIKNFDNNKFPYDKSELIKPFKSFNRDVNVSSHGLGLYVVDTILEKYDYKYLIEINDNTFEFKILL